MRISIEVQFIPATGQPEYAVVPYPVYLELQKCQELSQVPPVQATVTTLRDPLIGNPIKYWRQRRELSQSALAKLADISVPYLSQLEHDLRVGSKAVLLRLALALNVAIDQIL